MEQALINPAIQKAKETRETTKIVVRSDGYTLDRVDKDTGKVLEADIAPTTFEGFIRKWIHGKLGNRTTCGSYKADDDRLYYHWVDDYSDNIVDDILAIKLKDGRILGNAAKLEKCGIHRRSTEAPAQRVMFDMNIAMVPFNVFTEAKLDIRKAKIVAQGKEENLVMPKLVLSDSGDWIPEDLNGFQSSFGKKRVEDYMLKLRVEEVPKDYEYVMDKNGNHKHDKRGNAIKRYGTTYKYYFTDARKLAERHFVGAMIIQVKEKYFLFDLDRNEVKHYRFNPFLAELPYPVKTIEEAYESLKPKPVVDALKRGKKVLRQGEWFFIPFGRLPFDEDKLSDTVTKYRRVLDDSIPNVNKYDLDGLVYNSFSRSNSEEVLAALKSLDRDVRSRSRYKDMLPGLRKQIFSRLRLFKQALRKYAMKLKAQEAWLDKNQVFLYGGELRAGTNRPNRVEKLIKHNGITYVSGCVEHTGREHEPIELKTWHIAVPNTAVKSWTISGNID